MRFWIRHIILIVLCVVLPLGAALYFDTESEKDRARGVGASTVQAALRGLESTLRLEAHDRVGGAITLSQRLTDFDVMRILGRGGSRGQAAFAQTVQLLDGAAPPGGFAWLVDGEGRVVVENGQTEPTETPRQVTGHPLFAATQSGNALDGVWSDVEGLTLAAGAPLVDGGAASGAVIVGYPIDQGMVTRVAKAVSANVSLLSGDRVVATSLPPALADEIAAAATSGEVVFGGKRDRPLPSSTVPMLPLLIDRFANGTAYASAAAPVRGSLPTVRWVVSADSSNSLEALAQRQEIIFAALAASLLLALLVGLVNHRTFVRPIDKLAEHLSEIQLGRGDLELPEGRVSKPFRRLVRLINMTVQKVPARSLTAIGSTSDVGLEGRPVSRTGSLVVTPPQQLEPQNMDQFPPAPSAPPPAPPPDPAPVEPVVPDPVFASAPPPAPAPEALQIPDDLAPSLPPAPTPAFTGDDTDEAAAIAEAIASLEAGQSPMEAPPAPEPTPIPSGSSRAASGIRGTPMGSVDGMPSPFPPSQSEFLRDGSSLSSPLQDEVGASTSPAPGVRGGGSLDLSGYAGVMDKGAATVEGEGFGPEATVVAPVAEDLLAQSAREDLTDHHASAITGDEKPDMTVVASVPADLLAQSAGEAPLPDPPPPPPPATENGLDAADRAHFQEVYERFIDLRRRCGEKTTDLAFDRFLKKLTKNRENLIKKYHCRTVRFQVYEKDGKAALKATPVRAR